MGDSLGKDKLYTWLIQANSGPHMCWPHSSKVTIGNELVLGSEEWEKVDNIRSTFGLHTIMLIIETTSLKYNFIPMPSVNQMQGGLTVDLPSLKF